MSDGLDSLRFLAPEGYLRWLERAQASPPQVSRFTDAEGRQAYVLSVELEPNPQEPAILRSHYVVRAGDWLPVEQRLDVKASEGVVSYEIARVGFRVLSAKSLPSDFFAPDPHVATRRIPRRAPHSTLSEPAPMQVPVDELEQARSLLQAHRDSHDQGLCTRAALEGERFIMRTIARLESGLRSEPGGADREALLLNGATLLAALRADAAAVRPLLQGIPEERLAQLDASSQGLWRRLLADHLAALSRNAAALREVLATLLRSDPGIPPEAEVPGPSGWRAATLELLEETQALSGVEQSEADQPATDVHAVLRRAAELARRADLLLKGADEYLAALREMHVAAQKSP